MLTSFFAVALFTYTVNSEKFSVMFFLKGAFVTIWLCGGETAFSRQSENPNAVYFSNVIQGHSPYQVEGQTHLSSAKYKSKTREKINIKKQVTAQNTDRV